MIYYLSDDVFVPNPLDATNEGLLAVGGDLSVKRLLAFYSKGIFPWYSQNQPILWWAPIHRPVFKPGEIKFSKSFKQTIRSGKFEFKFDTAWDEVLEACADTEFRDENATWLTNEMKSAYTKLKDLGYAHSAEVYQNGELVGGLYGISIGAAFFGESMFHRVSDASKFALFALSENLKDWGFHFIDGQYPTEHLMSLGAKLIDNVSFQQKLSIALFAETKKEKWENEIKDFRKRI